MKWITAADIDNWTIREPRKAQESIPLLIWKLILASCNTINDHHFPFGKAIQYSGYDGFLDTDDTSPFFPSGKSVWEIGTNENALDKFNNDYEKRTKEPNGVDQANTVFCFVSSRIWNHRKSITEITEEKSRDAVWKAIRIIDASSLELWLDACPSVKLWFSGIMGVPNDDVQDIYAFWNDTVNQTCLQLTPEFFLHKRSPLVANLQSGLNCDRPNQIVLVAGSWLEAILCLSAEIVVSDDNSVISFGEKCIVAHTLDGLNQIDSHCKNVIIIPTFHLSDSSVSVRKNTIVLPVDRFDPLDKISRNGHRVEIPARTRHEFCEALEKLGYDSQEAYDLGQKLHCSFPALFRFLQTDPLKRVPEWSRHENSQRLIPALFAGAWDERLSGDIETISALAKVPYNDYIASISIFAKGENAPLFSVDHSYACISVGEMWDFLWTSILPENFSTFKECFLRVFSESDPAYELPEEQWYAASVYGKTASYSNQLKESLIVSLIMMIERENAEICVQFSDNISKECDVIVKQVFDSIDTLDKWRTICPHIPTLIEATPGIVLSVFEREVINPNSLIWDLFVPSSDSLFGRNFYTHILWALEKALWDKSYASRALKLLILFCEKHFEYKLTNKPEDTLYRVFCIWYPQGIFSFEQRKLLLDDIVKNHKTMASELVKALLSPGSQTSSPISKPKWKPIDRIQDDINVSEVQEMQKFISSLFLDSISPRYDDWKTVFSDLSMFADLSEIVDKCIKQVSLMCEEDVLKLCKDLSQYISHNKKFAHDSNERISEIERLYNAILPNTPKYFAHYFAYHFDGLDPIPYKAGEYDFERERNTLYEFQKGKMEEMIAKFGSNAVLDILPLVENTNAYASAIVDVVLDGRPNWAYIFKLRESNQYIASSIISQLYYKGGIKLITEGDGIPQDTNLGWTLSCLPLCEEITKIIEDVDCDNIKHVYWENVRVFGIKTDNTAWVNSCIHALLNNNRAYSVIDSFAYSDWNEPEIIMEVLSATLTQYPNPEPSGLQLSNVGSNDIEKLFKKLYQKPIVPDMDVARLELAYLKVFDIEFEPQCLMRQLLSSPEIYFELLTAAYRPDDKEIGELTEQQRKFAEVSFSALEHVHRIPGTSVGGNHVKLEEFDNWISKTNQLAKENNYCESHDIVLGKILSYSPVGEDGIWPAECVRNIFEKPHSETLAVHFIIGRENQRGVHTVTAGIEEEIIANNYKHQADELQLLYPQTAAILLRLSNAYHAESKAERARELKGLL